MTSLQNLYRGYHIQSANKRKGMKARRLYAHVINIPRAIIVAWSQNLDRDLPPTMFTFPHIPKPATVHWATHWIPVQLEMQ